VQAACRQRLPAHFRAGSHAAGSVPQRTRSLSAFDSRTRPVMGPAVWRVRANVLTPSRIWEASFRAPFFENRGGVWRASPGQPPLQLNFSRPLFALASCKAPDSFRRWRLLLSRPYAPLPVAAYSPQALSYFLLTRFLPFFVAFGGRLPF
jgi:hypothetical protein